MNVRIYIALMNMCVFRYVYRCAYVFIYIAPLQVYYTTQRRIRHSTDTCVGISRRSATDNCE